MHNVHTEREIEQHRMGDRCTILYVHFFLLLTRHKSISMKAARLFTQSHGIVSTHTQYAMLVVVSGGIFIVHCAL